MMCKLFNFLIKLYLIRLNLSILELKKSNILDKLIDKWWPPCKIDGNVENSISIDMVSGAFLTLIIGVSVALLVFCIQSITIKSIGTTTGVKRVKKSNDLSSTTSFDENQVTTI